MDKLARYGRETALGSCVLLFVLGAPLPVQAAPTIPGAVTGPQLCGEVIICCNDDGATRLDLTFSGHDICNPSGNTTSGSVCIPLGGTTGTFDFTLDLSDISCLSAGDWWELEMAAFRFCGGGACGMTHSASCSHPPGNTFCGGEILFEPDDTADVTTSNDFIFAIHDPARGSGLFPAATGVPELNADTMVNPLALAVATLLMLSDPRRRRQDS